MTTTDFIQNDVVKVLESMKEKRGLITAESPASPKTEDVSILKPIFERSLPCVQTDGAISTGSSKEQSSFDSDCYSDSSSVPSVLYGRCWGIFC